MLKKREKKVLIEILKDGRKPDKHIAQILNTSQPTVTRIRQRLEKKGIITSYRPYIDLKKIGLNVMAITVFKITDFTIWEKLKKTVLARILQMPEIINVALGEGLGGKTGILISLHKNFDDYQTMVLELRRKYGKYVTDIDQFVMSTDRIYKTFSTHEAVIGELKKE